MRLENKIREFETSTASSTPLTEELQRLQRENLILRRLLSTLGFNTKFQDMYIMSLADEQSINSGQQTVQQAIQQIGQQAGQYKPLHSSDIRNSSSFKTALSAPSIDTDKIVSPRAPDIPSQALASNTVSKSTPDDDQVNDATGLFDFDLDTDFLDQEYLDFLPEEGGGPAPTTDNTSDVPQTLPMSDQLLLNITASAQPVGTAINTSIPLPQPCLNSLENDASLLHVISNTAADPLASTLCSVAFQILARHNRRGLSDLDIEIRLCAGYIGGTSPSQACRVKNKVLFSVLAEVS